jgi:peptidoglycan/LPS O-acetylase OafA/YrhL
MLRGKIGHFVGVIGTAAASVGTYSYSIYLWHGPTNAWFPGFVKRVLHISLGANERFAVYMAGSLVIGITMSKIVEYPILRLRDRIFPPREGVSVRPSETSRPEAAPIQDGPSINLGSLLKDRT